MEVLHEREAEIEALTDALAEAAGGRGQVVVIEGPGGIGKSRLLAAARALAPTRMRILSAVAAELEQSFSFGVVLQLFGPAAHGSALDGAARLAAPVFEPTGTADADADTLFARLHGLQWLMANLADRGPLALLVDDVQWSDEASLRALAFLARRLEDLPVLLAVATRPASEPLIEELARVPWARRLEPRALSAAAVDAWVEHALAADADPVFVDAIVTATGGNPFLVAELVHEVRAGDLAPRAASAARVAALGPAGVARSVLGRLGFLPTPAGKVARALAVLGEGRSLSELAAFAEVDEEDAGRAALELERAGIVDGATGIRFVHPIIRRAVHGDLPAVERRLAHARAAVFLRERGARHAEVSAHILESDPRGDADAVALLRATAGEALVAGDPASASRLLRRALAERRDVAPALALELATAASLAGDTDAEERLYEAVDLAIVPEERVLAALRLVTFTLSSAATDRLEAALEPLPPGHPLAAMADAALVAAGQGRVSTRRHVLAHTSALPVCDGSPTGPREFAGLIGHAYVAGMDDRDPQRGVELARRALTAPPAAMPSALQRILRNIAAVPLLTGERFAEAEAVYDTLLDESRADGNLSEVAMWVSPRALARLRRGNLAGAEADALEGLELVDEIAGAEFIRGVCAAIAVQAGLELLRPPAALNALAEAHPPDPDMLPMNQCYVAYGALRLAVGDPAGALEYYRACDRPDPGWGRDCPSIVPWRSGAARALAQLGRSGEAEALAQEEFDLARTPAARGRALRVLGGVGEPELRRERFEAAVLALEDAASPVELAYALLDLGGELRRAGEKANARPLLSRAHELAAGVGASRCADLARSELRSAGGRVAATGGGGITSLTPSERRVADLAAAGRTNREIAQQLFLSPKTVETHLGSVFRKLDIASRQRLADRLRAAA